MFLSSNFAWLVINGSEEKQFHVLDVDLKVAQPLSQDQVNQCVASRRIFISLCGRRMENRRSDCNCQLVTVGGIKYFYTFSIFGHIKNVVKNYQIGYFQIHTDMLDLIRVKIQLTENFYCKNVMTQ